ncbi:MAG TPA: Ig-like domain-containing protein [Candidatus Saccharimonadales bacterium]|nr:Ig-like domain-containing protein [Candidatus Saccharimonadales bacterium]
MPKSTSRTSVRKTRGSRHATRRPAAAPHNRLRRLHRLHFGLTAILVLTTLLALGMSLGSSTSHSSAASCTVTAKLVDPCRPWLAVAANKYPNVSPNTTLGQAQAFTARTGKQVDANKVYHVAGDSLNSDDKYLATHDEFLMLNWKPVQGSWNQINTNPAAVNSSIDTMANSLLTVPNAKIMLTIWHEPENDVSPGGDPNCPGVAYKGGMGTVAQYKAMWQYVHDRLLADVGPAEAKNIVFAIDYMNYPPWNCLVPDLYPGDNLVDWIVFNAYGGANGQTFNQNVQGYYNTLTQAHPTKQFGIAEFSTPNVTSAQGVAYWNEARTAVEQNTFPRLKLYMIFDSVGPDGNENRGDYVTGGIYDQPKTNAFNAFVNSPAFVDATGPGPAPSPSPQPPTSGPDRTPPTVSLIDPADGAEVSGPLTVDATADDNVGVTSVTLIIDDMYIATHTSAPYDFTFDTSFLQPGNHVVSLHAWDAANNMGESNSIVITVIGQGGTDSSGGTIDGLPSLPADGSTSNNTVIFFGGSPTDNTITTDGGSITFVPSISGGKLTVRVDGKLIKGNTINTHRLPNGVHTITVTQDDQTITQRIDVHNPWPLSAINGFRANPVGYIVRAMGFMAVVSLFWWAGRKYGLPMINALRYRNIKVVNRYY